MKLLQVLEHFIHEHHAGNLDPCPHQADDGSTVDIAPEWNTALAVLSQRLNADSTPAEFDAACEAGAELFERGEFGSEVLEVTMQTIIDAAQDYGDKMRDAAQWN